MGIRWDGGMIDDEPTLPLKQRTALYIVDHRSNNPLLPPPNPPFPPSPHQDWKFLLVVDQTGAELVRY